MHQQQRAWFRTEAANPDTTCEKISKSSISEVFEAYYERIFNYISYRTGNRYTAEDLTSQVFEKIVAKYHTFQPDRRPLEVWIFTIAKNTLTDHFRASQRHNTCSLEAIEEKDSKQSGPEAAVINKESELSLIQALSVLTDKERQIIALRFGAGLKNVEIAKIMNSSESNVGVILFRSMKKLKKELEREDYSEA